MENSTTSRPLRRRRREGRDELALLAPTFMLGETRTAPQARRMSVAVRHGVSQRDPRGGPLDTSVTSASGGGTAHGRHGSHCACALLRHRRSRRVQRVVRGVEVALPSPTFRASVLCATTAAAQPRRLELAMAENGLRISFTEEC